MPKGTLEKAGSIMSQEEFALETRLVVLNFLGQVPLGHSSSSASGSDTHKSLHTQVSSSSDSWKASARSSGDAPSLRKILPTLPEVSLLEKVDNLERGSDHYLHHESKVVQKSEGSEDEQRHGRFIVHDQTNDDAPGEEHYYHHESEVMKGHQRSEEEHVQRQGRFNVHDQTEDDAPGEEHYYHHEFEVMKGHQRSEEEHVQRQGRFNVHDQTEDDAPGEKNGDDTVDGSAASVPLEVREGIVSDRVLRPISSPDLASFVASPDASLSVPLASSADTSPSSHHRESSDSSPSSRHQLSDADDTRQRYSYNLPPSGHHRQSSDTSPSSQQQSGDAGNTRQRSSAQTPDYERMVSHKL